ncbi:MAG TPA: glycoside hydrolase family 2 protein, partial [Ktedonobacterales bacterium]|nr:glycoside hydrolase family 2 protein [Ktedonobacterales bacterium]
LVARKDYQPAIAADANGAFPARAIYERRLPELCARLDPDRPYWPGSPYTPAEFGDDPNDLTGGDRHTWEIWHGPKLPYQEYAAYGGRFVSEFGMAALPERATIDAAISPDGRRFHSAALTHHFKADDGDERLDQYLHRHFWVPDDLDAAIYLSQLLQADALVTAIHAWRRRWNPPEHPNVGGALIWQLNDCWPAISWALADYYLRPKAAYYAVRRAFAPIAIGIARTPDNGAEIWGMNATTTPLTDVSLEIIHWSLAGDYREAISREITLNPHGATELGSLPWRLDEQSVVAVIFWNNGERIARATLWPESNDVGAWAHDTILLKTMATDRFRLTTRRPTRGVWLEADMPVVWDDNSFDLMPTERRDITTSSPLDTSLRIYHLGHPTGTEAGGLIKINEVK